MNVTIFISQRGNLRPTEVKRVASGRTDHKGESWGLVAGSSVSKASRLSSRSGHALAPQTLLEPHCVPGVLPGLGWERVSGPVGCRVPPITASVLISSDLGFHLPHG